MHSKKSFSAILLFCFISLSLCKIPDKEIAPGLLLTFDDRNMLHWAEQIPLFEKYDAHVTFFVDHFDELTTEQLEALQKLKNAGHAIGCHGLRHRKAVEYSEKYSIEKYITDEIAVRGKEVDEWVRQAVKDHQFLHHAMQFHKLGIHEHKPFKSIEYRSVELS